MACMESPWYWRCGRFALLMMAGSAAVLAQTVDIACDERLAPIPGSMGYQKRTTVPRCEGMYQSPVRAISLDVVSFLLGRLAFDLERDPQLIIVVPNASNLIGEAVHIRATGLPLKTYYRMDAAVAPGGQMPWPIQEVLKPLQLGPNRIGLFGWLGDETDKTYVPLIVNAEGAAVPSGEAAELKLRSPVDLERVLWRSRHEDLTASESSWQQIGTGLVRAGRTITVKLPPGPPAKLRVEFSAKRANMDDWLTFILFVIRTG